jgi:hypothetical protein
VDLGRAPHLRDDRGRRAGLADLLTSEFPADRTPRLALYALTYCDLTTGPDGQPVDVAQRIDEILTRYGPDDVVHQAISRASPFLRKQADEVIALLPME